MNATKTPKLETSKNYAAFLPNDEQRYIHPPHVKHLVQRMSDYGFLPSKPIQCFKRGAKFILIDGHHRLAAAKQLGIPFFYVLEPESNTQTMAAVNSTVKTWVLADYVRMYALRGNADYQNLTRYAESGIPVMMAASMLHGHAALSGNANELIKSGTFKIKETTSINRVYGMIQKFGEINPVVKHRAFIGALSDCLLTPEFDFERFERRFEESPNMIQKASNKDLQLLQLEELYNFRSREKVPLAFFVKANVAKRNAKAMGPKK